MAATDASSASLTIAGVPSTGTSPVRSALAVSLAETVISMDAAQPGASGRGGEVADIDLRYAAR